MIASMRSDRRPGVTLAMAPPIDRPSDRTRRPTVATPQRASAASADALGGTATIPHIDPAVRTMVRLLAVTAAREAFAAAETESPDA